MNSEQVTSLLRSIREAGGEDLAGELLEIASSRVPVEVCSIIAYSGGDAQTLSVAGCIDEGLLSETAWAYVRSFVPMDGIQQVIAPSKGAGAGAAAIWCQRMVRDEIESEPYRALYERLNLNERLAILCHRGDDQWLSVKLYRSQQRALLSDGEVGQLEAFAQLAAQATQLSYANFLHERDLAQVLKCRLKRIRPSLTGRESDLVSGILEGQSTAEIAAAMGVREVTLRTYQKRLYRKLGVSSLRELISLCAKA